MRSGGGGGVLRFKKKEVFREKNQREFEREKPKEIERESEEENILILECIIEFFRQKIIFSKFLVLFIMQELFGI